MNAHNITDAIFSSCCKVQVEFALISWVSMDSCPACADTAMSKGGKQAKILLVSWFRRLVNGDRQVVQLLLLLFFLITAEEGLILHCHDVHISILA